MQVPKVDCENPLYRHILLSLIRVQHLIPGNIRNGFLPIYTKDIWPAGKEHAFVRNRESPDASGVASEYEINFILRSEFPDLVNLMKGKSPPINMVMRYSWPAFKRR